MRRDPARRHGSWERGVSGLVMIPNRDDAGCQWRVRHGVGVAKLLPETVTALVEAPNDVQGELVTNAGVYVATSFVPYGLPANLEHYLRKLTNLNHLEVEKNAVPEALSLFEQYEVSRVEELQIADRWAKAQPNKSIASLIGWRGKSDYVYWDLHERAHGPHALVGGTTGSGKSEFLTTYLMVRPQGYVAGTVALLR